MEIEARLTFRNEKPPLDHEEPKEVASNGEIIGWLLIIIGCVVVTLSRKGEI